MNIEINCGNCARNHMRPNAKDRCNKEFLGKTIQYERKKRDGLFLLDAEKLGICPEWKSGASVAGKIYNFLRNIEKEGGEK